MEKLEFVSRTDRSKETLDSMIQVGKQTYISRCGMTHGDLYGSIWNPQVHKEFTSKLKLTQKSTSNSH